MNNVNHAAEDLAQGIAFDGMVEAVLRRHTALICWNKPGVSPVFTRADNGTCCFLQTDRLRCVSTCAHVWDGYLEDAARKGAGTLWLSLIANDEPLAPSWPYEVHEPALFPRDADLDLATFTFDGIDALEPWRFHRLRHTPRSRPSRGEIVFFLGYTGAGLRATSPQWKLSFMFFALEVADVGHRGFLLHDPPGRRHLADASGREIQPQRIPGISGAPVFRLANPGPSPVDLRLAGFVSRLSSPGLCSSPSERVGAESTHGYEMSDGDIYAVHSGFVRPDGSIGE